MKHLSILLFVFFIAVTSCSTQEKLTQYDGVEIIFGNGGGFTGQEISYKITNDGQLSMTDGLKKEETDLDKISAGKTLKIFDQLSSLENSKIDFDHPGNMYYFIKEVKGSKMNKIVWGDDEYKVPQDILDYYQLLNSYVNEK